MATPDIRNPVWPKGASSDDFGNALNAGAPFVRGYRYRDGQRYLAVVQEALVADPDYTGPATKDQILAVVYPDGPTLDDAIACHRAAHAYRDRAFREGGFHA